MKHNYKAGDKIRILDTEQVKGYVGNTKRAGYDSCIGNIEVLTKTDAKYINAAQEDQTFSLFANKYGVNFTLDDIELVEEEVIAEVTNENYSYLKEILNKYNITMIENHYIVIYNV